MSLSWVQGGTHVFYHRRTANEWVPTIVLAPSHHSGDYLHIQCEVNGMALINDAAEFLTV